MVKRRSGNSSGEYENIFARKKQKKFVLRLYVTGTTPRSISAIDNIIKICEAHLKGLYDLEVIDIYQQPLLLKGEQIIAAPTLIKKLPPPIRKFIGDLSDAEKILLGLDLRIKKEGKNGQADQTTTPGRNRGRPHPCRGG